jgi:two-component system invasion response regulator UvrY
MIRVLIADDHTIVRRGLIDIITQEDDMVIAGEVADGAGVLRFVREDGVDVVVLDIALPDQNGLDVLHHIKGMKPGLSVLMLSVHPEEQYAVRALKSGASGYLTKDSAPDELVAAIRKAAQGGKYVSRTLAEQLAQQLDFETEAARHESLSDREFQVFLRMARGMPLTEIAEQLFLSPKTISSYRSRILEKMGFRKNAEIVRYAIEKKLID